MGHRLYNKDVDSAQKAQGSNVISSTTRDKFHQNWPAMEQGNLVVYSKNAIIRVRVNMKTPIHLKEQRLNFANVKRRNIQYLRHLSSKMTEKKHCNLNMMKDAPVHVHQTSNYTRIIFIVIVQSQFMLFYNI